MIQNVMWKTASGCDSATCVGVGRCEGASCVEVGRCESGNCVEVGECCGNILIRDTKLDDSPQLSYTPQRWEALCARVNAGEAVDWAVEFYPLCFTGEETEALEGGIRNREFELVST